MKLVIDDDTKFHFEKTNTGYVIVIDTELPFIAYGNTYIVKPGYISNGMSVPRFLWSLISPQYDPKTLYASIAHDWLYDNHVLTRKQADKWYFNALKQYGNPVWKCWLIYWAVRLFGASHW